MKNNKNWKFIRNQLNLRIKGISISSSASCIGLCNQCEASDVLPEYLDCRRIRRPHSVRCRRRGHCDRLSWFDWPVTDNTSRPTSRVGLFSFRFSDESSGKIQNLIEITFTMNESRKQAERLTNWQLRELRMMRTNTHANDLWQFVLVMTVRKFENEIRIDSCRFKSRITLTIDRKAESEILILLTYDARSICFQFISSCGRRFPVDWSKNHNAKLFFFQFYFILFV